MHPGHTSILGYNTDLNAALALYVDDHCMSFADFDAAFSFLHECYFPRIAFAAIPLSGKKTEPLADTVDSMRFPLRDGKILPAE